MFNPINMYFIDALLAGCAGLLAKLAGMVVPLVVGLCRGPNLHACYRRRRMFPVPGNWAYKEVVEN
ncbi:hypothetical protein QBC32DRAFT_312684 [Pseudoneurospora amorphoporcata]|uniref:Uncharacterized protein n=1 Tax=Pseudoneurospora amorphoporcata TaxID=241081 RepID=A0AAN6NXJ3_9PEZI|nr:hypothetical protein QBC32DRAFT_312684 [Pseudoneurospora amorphoporcata]